MTEKRVYHERELTEPVSLCLPGGCLNREAVGWSRYPIHNCRLTGSPLRKKRWNYWCVITDRFLFSATLSDIDYLGLAFIYFLDFESLDFHELTVNRLLGQGCDLGDFVSDDALFEDRRLKLSFKTTGSSTEIKAECPDFGGREFLADLSLIHAKGHETLNVVIPWSDHRFQFTSKQHTIPTTGTITVGDRVYDAEGGFACLDFGRGKWPFSSFWNWAGASGESSGHKIGLNFGAGWTDGTGMNENGFCIDWVLTKISEDLLFQYNPGDFMKPWRIKTVHSDLVDLEFKPFFERMAKTEAIILGSEVHQMIGRFSGMVKDAAGKSYSIDDFVGWAEEHKARW